MLKPILAISLGQLSAEVVTLFQPGRLTWAMSAIAAHVSGSLLMSLSGLASWQLLKPT